MSVPLPLSLVLFHCRFSDTGPLPPLAWSDVDGAADRLPYLHLLIASNGSDATRPACALLARSNMPHRHHAFRLHALALLQAGPPSLRLALPRQPRVHVETLVARSGEAMTRDAAAVVFDRAWHTPLVAAPQR